MQDFGTKKGKLGKQQMEMMRQTESLLAAQAEIGGGIGGAWAELLEQVPVSTHTETRPHAALPQQRQGVVRGSCGTLESRSHQERGSQRTGQPSPRLPI